GFERQLKAGPEDLLAVLSAGAYGFAMASNYNSRLRPPEIMVDGRELHIVRRRETIEELTQAEAVLP
ncbi:MAG: diaminopimelate decarboxylase, partial [Gammaproteobacteria bacterium]|nr:diaminopimelate decarboxylase [Gammaproteobacteria bacterium]